MSIKDKFMRAKADYDEVYEAGKNKVLRDMWEGIQKGGKRTDYNNAFLETSITDEMFKPIYDLRPTTAYRMFFGNVGITDLKNIPVQLDFSQCVELQYAFYGMMDTNIGTGIKRVGVLDCRSLETWRGHLHGLFNWDIYLEEVEKIILPDNGVLEFPSAFNACYALKEIRFEGVIGQDINFADCPLSRASIESIMTALSTTSSGKTLTLNADAVHNAFTDAEWSALKATRSNWNFNV